MGRCCQCLGQLLSVYRKINAAASERNQHFRGQDQLEARRADAGVEFVGGAISPLPTWLEYGQHCKQIPGRQEFWYMQGSSGELSYTQS